jgi:hypothetical protein
VGRSLAVSMLRSSLPEDGISAKVRGRAKSQGRGRDASGARVGRVEGQESTHGQAGTHRSIPEQIPLSVRVCVGGCGATRVSGSGRGRTGWAEEVSERFRAREHRADCPARLPRVLRGEATGVVRPLHPRRGVVFADADEDRAGPAQHERERRGSPGREKLVLIASAVIDERREQASEGGRSRDTGRHSWIGLHRPRVKQRE